jgi:hypothetical protein
MRASPSWAAQIARARIHLACHGGRGLIRDWRGLASVANAPQFFDLALVDPPARVGWDHAAYTPDVVVVSLGTNDFNLKLGPFPPRDGYVTAYVDFVRTSVVEATHDPGDACNPHPTSEQHAQMARDLEPVIRRTMGW